MGATVFERRRPSASAVRHALAGTARAVFWRDDLPAELRPRRPRLTGTHDTDLVVVGGGYAGLWTALLATERMPGARIALLEGERVGWAASGRNGGFCSASLTHGHENGMSRWPDEMPLLDRLGMANLDAIEAAEGRYGMDFQFERTGELEPAVEPHQVTWLQERHAEAQAAGEDGVVFLDESAVRAQVNSPIFLAGLWEQRTCGLVHPARLAAELARVAEERGVEIFEGTRVRDLRTPGVTGVTAVTEDGSVTARHAALATNAFPALLRRNRLMTVPVYDYVLMTEPLSNEQLASIGWTGRQGIGDMANQFHYYRLSRDNRILFGGYDAIYHFGRRLRAKYENRPESWERLASHFLTTFPQLEGVRFTHKWAGAIDACTQFTAFFGVAKTRRIAYTAGFTGLGVGSTRFAAEVMLDLLAGERNERTQLEMVRRKPLPFPPEPAAALGINATRWSLDRADHREGRRNLLLKMLDTLGMGFDS